MRAKLSRRYRDLENEDWDPSKMKVVGYGKVKKQGNFWLPGKMWKECTFEFMTLADYFIPRKKQLWSHSWPSWIHYLALRSSKNPCNYHKEATLFHILALKAQKRKMTKSFRTMFPYHRFSPTSPLKFVLIIKPWRKMYMLGLLSDIMQWQWRIQTFR